MVSGQASAAGRGPAKRGAARSGKSVAVGKARTAKSVSVGKARTAKSVSAGKAVACGKAQTYTVVAGDNLTVLSREFDVSVAQITRLNRDSAKKLRPGAVLIIRPAIKCKPKPTVKKASAEVPEVHKAADGVWTELKGKKASKKDVVKDSIKESGTVSGVGSEKILDDESDDDEAAADQDEEATDNSEPPKIDSEPQAKPQACQNSEVETDSDRAPDEDPDLDEVGTDGTDVGEDDQVGESDDDKDTVADDEPEDLVPLPESAGFGFLDDGSACNSCLNAFSPMPTERKGAVNFYHKVKKGETLSKIAKKYHVPLKTLQKMNHCAVKAKGKGKVTKKNNLRVGYRILVRIGDPADLMKYRPFLKDWGDLHAQQGYSIKRKTTTFGRPWAFNLMLRAVCELRRRNPDMDLANVVVGDWSGTLGGPLGRHKSHQTGRDVDLSYFVTDQKCGNYFVRATPLNIDLEKNWEMIRALLDTKRVQYIFMDWNLQKVLYEYALSKGFPVSDLDLVFQYPEPRQSRTGIIRWARGHDDHIHVRFSCPPVADDPLCR